ncbi:RHS repeat domain-containing protein [Saccharibacillus sp. JS10]|uniref:RHS repeat domain-containing protein n=1 Tax=Saccharibacillus sp. JS10 TaxID=2950552 RepID=UPI00210B167D|nr:RHS repeat-associated core domain-containing protein [Saccharibacillus sp. JS10]MCQ4087554.1 RHS repeat-associated core domain-containing protein [Saccharibacillus sp. JS10]
MKLGDNGQITTTYTNDGFGRLTKLLQSAGGLTQAFTYGYDNGDNITSRSDGTTSGTFSYDELDRIITSSEGDETYTYDGKGNRLTLQSSIQMPHKDNIDYTYNQAEQLSGVTRNQTSVSYKYNGDGLMTERSITKDGQSTTTRYYYDGANIIAEGTVAADGSVTFKARYVRGAQLIYREDANHEKAYYQHNGHGDVTGLVKADGTVLNRYTYDIWGNPLTSDVQVENVFGYSGEYWDEDTGLQYLRSRWYDPSIGRFIQEDTFEGYMNRPSSSNPYTYVENNPLKYLDPSGRSAIPFPNIDWNKVARIGFEAVSGSLEGAKANKKYGPVGMFFGVVVGGLLGNPTSMGEDQASVDRGAAQYLGLTLVAEATARSYRNRENSSYVFRALNKQDVKTLGQGRGLAAKNPAGNWTLTDHVAYGSNTKESVKHDKWLSTTPLFDRADFYDRGSASSNKNGIAIINLKKLNQKYYWAEKNLNPSHRGYSRALAFAKKDAEISVLKYINREAIVGWVPSKR